MIDNVLSKEALLSADDRQVETVPAPEWGGLVYVRPLSGNQRDELEERYQDDKSMIGIRAWIAAAGLCDRDGTSMGFTPAEVKELGDKSGAALDRVAAVVKRISVMTAEDVQELEKNSEDDQSDSSG